MEGNLLPPHLLCCDAEPRLSIRGLSNAGERSSRVVQADRCRPTGTESPADPAAESQQTSPTQATSFRGGLEGAACSPPHPNTRTQLVCIAQSQALEGGK